MQGSLSAAEMRNTCKWERKSAWEKKKCRTYSESWVIMSGHYNWTVVSFTYLSTHSHRRRCLDGTRKLSVLLRIKISSKSYGRLQTNRAVAFPTGCRNFRRLSTFPTALAATSPILLSPTSFYAYPRPTATICKVKQSCFFIFSTLFHTRFFFIAGSEDK